MQVVFSFRARLEKNTYVFEKKEQEWDLMRSKNCDDTFTANASPNFFPGIFCSKNKRHGRSEPGLFKEEYSWLQQSDDLGNVRIWYYESCSNKSKFS